MRLEEYISCVEPEYRLDFIELLQTGLCRPEYYNHIEWCSGCQHAMSLAARDQRGIYRAGGMHGTQHKRKI